MAINIFEFEQRARDNLAKPAWDYYASGANGELTLRENCDAFDRLRLLYRVLVDVSNRDMATQVLGHTISMPIVVAPTAFHKLACADGEIATVRAAGGAGTIMILSTLSNTAIEDVVEAASGPVLFQLYVYKDRGATRALVERAEAAGAKALVLTVDAPLLGKRERDVRNKFQLPKGLSIENMLPAGMASMPTGREDSGLAAYFADLLDPALTWSDVEWLQSISRLPVVVKGIVRADDAAHAVDAGAAGVVVSNHGGRQLDTAPATIDVLEDIVNVVDDRADVLLDGGVRRGTDVVKAIALGATAVMLGRPILWGLGADGEAGARAVLALLRDELDLAMALCGAPTIADLTEDLIL